MYALLVPAAVLVTFVAIFAGGALVGLAGLAVQALRAAGRARTVKAEVLLSKPIMRPARQSESVMAETFVDASAAYAPA
jgi:hypothetical protein